MRRPAVPVAGCAGLALAVVSALLVVTMSPTAARTVRQRHIAYAKGIYRLPLADFLLQQRHWLPIWQAKGVAGAHHADWSSDGCSGGFWVWVTIDGEFPGARWEDVFRNDCIRHDFGYRNFGKGRLDGLAYASTPQQRKVVDSRLYAEATGRCGTFPSKVHDHCLEAAAAMYAGVRLGGSDAFYGKGCYAHALCLQSSSSDRSISVSTANLGTRWEFNDKASSATNRAAVAWKVFNDADYHGKWTCVPPGATVSLPTTTSPLLPFRHRPAASSVLEMAGSSC